MADDPNALALIPDHMHRDHMADISNIAVRIGIGALAGVAMTFIDNAAFGGEVSPIVIVGLLLLFCALAASIWGPDAVVAAAVAWICLPLGHVLKHALGLADTLHPNTWASILKLGVFTLVVAAVGLGAGLGLRKVSRSRPAGAP